MEDIITYSSSSKIIIINSWFIASLIKFIFNIVIKFQIEKKEVDSFKEGKRIPSCQLMVKCDSEQVTDLELQPVNLKGAREPYNIFTINIIGKIIYIVYTYTSALCLLFFSWND